MPSLLKRRGSRTNGTRILYATDLHGSTMTWRKFVNAAKFYDVDALVCGGDLMGKIVVPVLRQPGATYVSRSLGVAHEIRDDVELAEFSQQMERQGHYLVVMDPDQYEAHQGDQDAVDELFDRLAVERLEQWVVIAEERLAGTPVRCFLTGGNDDTDEFLAVLQKLPLEAVVACEGQVVPLDGTHTIASLGYSTPTPWKTPREKSDEELAVMIDDLVAQIPDPSRCVFNFHVPPIDSGLDTCALLDESVWPPAPVVQGGQPVEFGAGSESVRRALRDVQPAVGLHGHIHESRGSQQYGRSPAVNPGSSYNEGVLKGVIVTLVDGEVRGVQFTSG